MNEELNHKQEMRMAGLVAFCFCVLVLTIGSCTANDRIQQENTRRTVDPVRSACAAGVINACEVLRSSGGSK